MHADSPSEKSVKAGKLSLVPVASPPGWKVSIGDDLFAGYQADFKGTPILFPLIAPGGHEATRGFPMRPALPTEKADHDHHRSMWLNHGEVNDVDFWIDDEGCGRIEQTSASGQVAPGSTAAVQLRTTNDWNGPDGKRILSDVRQYTFSLFGEHRVIDCDFRLIASDGDVHFGDTKEGSFGIRVAGTMKVDSKLGGKIIDADGRIDGEAWGKQSSWVDYSGPVEKATVGITIMNHPSSFHYPCRWHVRTYGLFAANPFGESHFTGGEKTKGYTLPAGEKLDMSFRVILREGALDSESTAKHFDQYAKSQRPVLDVK
jgi:hypothetical protein